MEKFTLSQGAEVTADGIQYRIWAPGRNVAVQVFTSPEASPRTISLTPEAAGYHRAVDPEGRPGDRYLIEIDGKGMPCPVSRWQPDGINGPSLVVDASQYRWSDAKWQRPSFRDLSIYEIHIGTFTQEGTFRAAIERLPYLVELGVSAIEIMPIADFPGERNWGYDGVRLYAPARAYGSPDDLRALVDAAHGHGLAVILDVVYNHFGPEGNFLKDFAPDYFEHRHVTPWGDAVNFGGEHARAVRAYFIENLLYWMAEFHMDGFRLDATHQIFDDSETHILEEMADAVHARGGYIIAEDERNDPRLIFPKKRSGFGLDAVWADDFHHTIEVALIDASRYRDRFAGELKELASTLENGWIYEADRNGGWKRMQQREDWAEMLPERFVFCISNHDQIGNRALGERLNHFVSQETYRAASALLCLVPYTPLLFMGQEWSASTPFLYFTDHPEELGRLVEEGRKREMEESPIFQDALKGQEPPSPQADDTFNRSKLAWEEIEQTGHSACLELYRAALQLRKKSRAFRPHDRSAMHVHTLESGVLALRTQADGEDWLLLCDLRGGHSGSLRGADACHLEAGKQWQLHLSSNDARFGGNGESAYDAERGEFHFTHPEVLVFAATAV